MVPPLPRLPDAMEMIEGKFYFLIHAPRQSGKTTFLFALADEINERGRMYALYCSLEVLDSVNDIHRAISTIASEILEQLAESGIDAFDRFASGYRPDPKQDDDEVLIELLTSLSASLDKDLVVLFDEVDCLSAGPLILFLKQIRFGHNDRDRTSDSRFPRSLALIGLRNLRHYTVQVRPGDESLIVVDFLNFVKKFLTLPGFTKDQIEILYGQHTEATGQVFEPSAIERAFYWSWGQPWLVNALANRVVSEILRKAPSAAITGEHMDQAAEILIRRQDTHLDYLLERLKEPSVRRVVEPVIIGAKRLPAEVRDDDLRYALDLGLLSDSGDLMPANPIYQEAIIRILAEPYERLFNKSLELARANRWVDGESLDMTSLMKTFQEVWREKSGAIKDPNGYDQAMPILVLNAYLQRIIGVGVERLSREYGLGRRRFDILVRHKGVTYPVMAMMRPQKGLEDRLEQIRDYMDVCGAKEGWLVIFDRESGKPWEEKISWETREVGGARIHLVGC
jgi:hypothetical protein